MTIVTEKEQTLRKEILGISQIVLGVGDMDPARAFFAAHGFSETGHMGGAANPPEKREFIAGTMSKTHDLTMLSPAVASPPIELVRPQYETKVSPSDQSIELPTFEAVLGTPQAAPGSVETDTVLASLDDSCRTPLSGVRLAPDCGEPAGVVALVVHATDVDRSLALWRQLRFEPNFLSPGMARIDARGLIAGSGLSVFFIAAPTTPRRTEPDVGGIICATFLCKNVEKLVAPLASAGHQVGQRFEIAPFGNRVRVFFLRTPSGELYEFLSIS